MAALRSSSRGRVVAAATLLVCCCVWLAAAPVGEAGLSRLLRQVAKVVGIEALVRHFADPLNDFINRLLLNNKVENREKTKVVPIVSFGERKAVGAAQVSGSDEALDKVRAVILYEDIFSQGQFRIKALVPGDSADPTKFSRVYGCGVTAVIDVKI